MKDTTGFYQFVSEIHLEGRPIQEEIDFKKKEEERFCIFYIYKKESYITFNN